MFCPGVPVQRPASHNKDIQQEEVISHIHVPAVVPAVRHDCQPVRGAA